MFPAKLGPLLVGSRKADPHAKRRRRTKPRRGESESRHGLPEPRQPE